MEIQKKGKDRPFFVIFIDERDKELGPIILSSMQSLETLRKNVDIKNTDFGLSFSSQT